MQVGGFIVTYAETDPRFTDNPLVRGVPGIRSYAGVQLSTDADPLAVHPYPAACPASERALVTLARAARIRNNSGPRKFAALH